MSYIYIYISNYDRNKFDAKSLKCTFVGYSNDDFGYKLCHIQ